MQAVLQKLRAIYELLCKINKALSESISVEIASSENITVDVGQGWEDLFNQITTAIETNTNVLENGTLSVTIDGQPIDVTGTVTVDSITNAVTVDWNGIATALENLPVNATVDFTALTDYLDTADLTVSLNDELLNIDFTDVITAINNRIVVDYEKTEYCILDSNGVKVPMTGVYTERKYTHTGVLISTETVLSQLVSDGTWGTYTLQNGESIGACPKSLNTHIIEGCIDEESFGYTVVDDAGNPLFTPRPYSDAGFGECGTCSCKETGICVKAALFDNYKRFVSPGSTSAFEIVLDGVTQATIVHDYTTSSDGVNTSSYYTPIISEINAVPGWSATLDADVPIDTIGKVTYRIEYSGSGPSELIVRKASDVSSIGNQDAYIFRVNSNGMLTTAVEDGGAEFPDFNTPIFSACE